MADKKISQLSLASTPLTGNEILPVVQTGNTVGVSVSNLTAGRAVSATNVSNGLGAVGTPSYTFTGDANTGMWSPAADTLAFSEGGVEVMRITSAALVGVGTAAPEAKFHVVGPQNGSLARFGATVLARSLQINQFAVGGAAETGYNFNAPGAGGNAALTFSTLTTERLRIDANGQVGIGTTSANGLLHIASTAPTFYFDETDQAADEKKWRWSVSSKILSLQNVNDANNASANAYQIVRGTGTATDRHVFFTGAGSERMRIDSNGNVGINETAPDYRLDVNGAIGFTPGASVTPVDNGDVVFELTNNTTLTVKAKGSDGVVRSGTITLA